MSRNHAWHDAPSVSVCVRLRARLVERIDLDTKKVVHGIDARSEGLDRLQLGLRAIIQSTQCDIDAGHLVRSEIQQDGIAVDW